MNSQRIYLDHAATTPVRHEVADEMRRVASDANFNPSSLHAEGRRAAATLDEARERIAAVLGATRKEIVFTASGTESNNLALLGVARAAGAGAHVLSAAFEHHAVLGALDRLRDEGFEVTLLPIGRRGIIDVTEFAAALRPHTVVASIMYANNEIGTLQPIAELTKVAHQRGVLFHTDAVAASYWSSLDVSELGVDLLSLSAHKFYGPKGVGALFVRRGVPLVPTLYGGDQEFGRRPGTPNVAGIAGMALALELAATERKDQSSRIGALRDSLERGLVERIPEVRVNGAPPRLPSVLNLSFADVESAALVVRLDLEGIAVSAGSACTSGSPQASHVIAAMGLEPRWAQGSIRFSLGAGTTAAEVARVLEVLPPLLHDLRQPPAAELTAASPRRDG